MEQEILKRLADQDAKIDQILASQKKMERYFFWTFVITVAVIVLPLIGLAFALPAFFNYYGSISNLSSGLGF